MCCESTQKGKRESEFNVLGSNLPLVRLLISHQGLQQGEEHTFVNYPSETTIFDRTTLSGQFVGPVPPDEQRGVKVTIATAPSAPEYLSFSSTHVLNAVSG